MSVWMIAQPLGGGEYRAAQLAFMLSSSRISHNDLALLEFTVSHQSRMFLLGAPSLHVHYQH
jgi:hypothetical protein